MHPGRLAVSVYRAGLRRFNGWCVAALCWTFASSVPTLAAQVDYGVGFSLIYENNIDRTQANQRPELTQSVMAGVLLQDNSSDVTAAVLAQMEHRHFTRGTFNDDTTAFIDGHALWTMVPRRLTWLLNETFREVQLNLTAPDTPSNRAKSNTLETGPDLTLAVDSSNSIVLSGKYGRFDVQNSLSDTRRYVALVRGVHSLSPEANLSLNYQPARVYFEPGAAPFPKVLREDWYGRYEALNPGGNNTAIELGTSRVTRYAGDPLEGHIVRVAVLRARTPETSVRIGYADEISDTYSDQIRGVAATTGPQDPGVVVLQASSLATADFYHSRRADVSYLSRGDIQYTLTVYGRKVDFFTLDEDYDEKGATLGLNWFYSSVMRFNAYGGYLKRTYLTLSSDPTNPDSARRVDADRNFYAGADYKLSGNVTISLWGQVARRDSNAPGIGYVDRRVMLLLGFTTSRAFEIRSRR